MAWQTAPGMIIIVGGFSVVGALYAGVDGLRNWIYNKVSRPVSAACCLRCVLHGCRGGQAPPLPAVRPAAADGLWRVCGWWWSWGLDARAASHLYISSRPRSHVMPASVHTPHHTPQPRYIQQDDFDFLIRKKYGHDGKKM